MLTDYINEQIKKLFGKKETFCEKQGLKYKDFASKLRTLENKVDWINKFLSPLDLEVQIGLKSQTREGKNIKTDTSTTDD